MPATPPADSADTPGDYLYWDSDSVGKLMARNNIHDRGELARAIDKPYSTVCRMINDDWSGRISTTSVLTAMCRTFNVPLHKLVIEPRDEQPTDASGEGEK